MAQHPLVKRVSENSEIRLQGTQTPVPSWGLDRIDQRDPPLNNAYTYEFTGATVHIYIIDSGIRATHQEFAGRIGNGFDATDNGALTASLRPAPPARASSLGSAPVCCLGSAITSS